MAVLDMSIVESAFVEAQRRLPTPMETKKLRHMLEIMPVMVGHKDFERFWVNHMVSTYDADSVEWG